MRPTKNASLPPTGSKSTPPRFEFFPLSMIDLIDTVHTKMLDQKENTCGPYVASYILQGLGFSKFRQHDISEDLLASLAGVHISPGDEKHSRYLLQEIAQAKKTLEEIDRESHSTLYLYSLPTSEKEEELGSSSEGVGRAIEVASEFEVSVIPISSREKPRGRIIFEEQKFQNLLDLVMEKAWNWNLQIILNLQCSHLLDPSKQNYGLLDVLVDLWNRKGFPLDSWNVGHFVSIAGFFDESHSSSQNHFRCLVVRDSYKKRGIMGVHLQPQENIRKALIRSDGRQGGILLLVDNQVKNEARQKIEKVLGTKALSYWDNGTPFRLASLDNLTYALANVKT